MTQYELETAVEAAKAETKTAIETMYQALNQGQRKQIVKNEKVERLFERHGVAHDN